MRYLREDSQGFLDDPTVAPSVVQRLVHCEGCGFWLTNPRFSPAALDRLYGRTGQDYFAPLAEVSAERIGTFRRAVDLARRAGIVGGRVLDLGCGTGQALSQWPPSFSRFGVEPSAYAARQAREAAGAQVHVGDLEAARHPAAYFDVVTAFDVLEHLHDPLGVIGGIARILRPGGLFVAETGDIGSLNARLAGGHWYYVRLPGHISFFSRRTMAKALRRSGFATVEVYRLHHGGCNARAALGYLRAMTRHLLIQAFGARVLGLPMFRSRNLDYTIRYLWDHMLAVAVRGPARPAEELENR